MSNLGLLLSKKSSVSLKNNYNTAITLHSIAQKKIVIVKKLKNFSMENFEIKIKKKMIKFLKNLKNLLILLMTDTKFLYHSKTIR